MLLIELFNARVVRSSCNNATTRDRSARAPQTRADYFFAPLYQHSKVVQCAVLPIENNGPARMHEEAEARARGASWHMGRDVYVLSQRDHFIL